MRLSSLFLVCGAGRAAAVEWGKKALLVVDMQNDFIFEDTDMGTGLPVANAASIIPKVNQLIAMDFDLKIFTEDFHPENHISLARVHGKQSFDVIELRYKNDEKNYPVCSIDGTAPTVLNYANVADCSSDDTAIALNQTLWPDHCLQGTPGQQLHDDLDIPEDAIVIKKGFTTVVDSYGVFGNNLEHTVGNQNLKNNRHVTLTENGLTQALRANGVTEVYIAGLALDYCVKWSAEQAKRRGFKVTVLEDASAAINSDNTVKADLIAEGIDVIDVADITLTSRVRKLEAVAHFKALVVVDLQNDFISGSLSVPDASTIIENVNTLSRMENFDLKIYTEDFHPFDHKSFASQYDPNTNTAELKYKANEGAKSYYLCSADGQPHGTEDCVNESTGTYDINQTLWPDHCVQNTDGQLIQDEVFLPYNAIVIKKGFTTEVDSYGVFANNLEHKIGYDNIPAATRASLSENGLTNWLEASSSAGVTHIYLAGLAYDYCVRWSAEQAVRRGFFVTVVSDASKAIGDASFVTEILTALGVTVKTTQDIAKEFDTDSGCHGLWASSSLLVFLTAIATLI
jgi:nicotinamidase/pyrazinamidase